MHKKIFLLSLPLMLTNTTVPIIGIVNTSLVGHLNSSSYLAAVGLGVSAVNFVSFLFAFFRMSMTGLVAQNYVKNSKLNDLATLLIKAIIVALVLATIVFLLKSFILSLLLRIVTVDLATRELLINFYNIAIYIIFFTLVNYVFLGFLIGIGKTKTVFYSSLVLMISSIILSLVFLKVFNLKSSGIALSLVISYAINTACLCLCVCLFFRKGQLDIKQIFKKEAFLNIKSYIPFLKLNSNIFIRSVCLLISINSFYILSSGYGKDVLAANTVLVEVSTFFALFLDAVANVTELLVAQAYAEKNQKRFKEVISKTLQQCLMITLALVIVYIIFSQEIIQMFTSISDVKFEINKYVIFSIMLPLISSFSFWIDGVFVGLLKTVVMRNAMLGAMIVYLISAYSLSVYSNYGLWVALMIFYVARTVLLALPLRIYLKKGLNSNI